MNYRNTALVIGWLAIAIMPANAIPGPAWKKVQIRYEITGVFDYQDVDTRDIYYKFHGGVFVSPNADPNTGEVSKALGPLLGVIHDWRLRFVLRNNLFSNLDTRIDCKNKCEIILNDGGILQLIVDNPKTRRREQHLPMQVRFMPELGEVPFSPTPDSNAANQYQHHLRAIGCMGFREVSGRGYFANSKGAMCINGTFQMPNSIRDQPLEAMQIIKGQSNATLVMHSNP